MKLVYAFIAMTIASFLSAGSAAAADYPAPRQGDFIAQNFKFHTGEIMPELKLHYATVGEPTGEKADRMYEARINGPFHADANDFVYQWDASHDFNPSAALDRIEAPVLLINAADDERNPPETGLTEAAMKRVKNGKLYLIPASTETRGHSTTGNAKFYSTRLRDFIAATAK